MKTAIALVLGFLVASACGGSTENPGGTGGSGGTGGTGPVYDACQKSSDCVVRSASCCGQCGAATRDDVVAINQDQASAYAAHACPDGAACPACYTPQDGALIATCAANVCKVVDLLLHASTACTSDAECRIRTNVCCECGGPMTQDHIIAISSEASFTALVCDPLQGCADCAPIYPTDAKPFCNDKGHCAVGWLVN